LSVQLKKMKVEIAELSKNPEGLLLEAIHSAGFLGPLANPLLAPESSLDRLNGDILEEFVAVRPWNFMNTEHLLICYAPHPFTFIKLCALLSVYSFTYWFLMWNFRSITQLLGWSLLHPVLNLRSSSLLRSHCFLTSHGFHALMSQNLCMLEGIIANKLLHRSILFSTHWLSFTFSFFFHH